MKLTVLSIIFTFINILLLAGNTILIEENFDFYKSVDNIKNWHFSGTVNLDTANSRSKKNCLVLKGNTTMRFIGQTKINSIGKVVFSAKTSDGGTCKIITSISETKNADQVLVSALHFNKEISADNHFYQTNQLEINKSGRFFFDINFLVPDGTMLYIDDLLIYEISLDEKIKAGILTEKRIIEADREKAFDNLMKNKDFKDVEKVEEKYRKLYIDKIATLARLSDKTRGIVAINGFASSVGNYVQLSNPMKYDKYKSIRNQLVNNLNPLDTLYLSDELEGKAKQYYEEIKAKRSSDKISGVLDLAIGVGDMFTGGAVTNLIGGMKKLITSGFSNVRGNERKVKEKMNKGVKLYMVAKAFFDDIENENKKAITLLSRYDEVYREAVKLEKDLETIFPKYFNVLNIEVTALDLISLSKNQTYNQYNDKIKNKFTELKGTKSEYDPNKIAEKAKEIDRYIKEMEGFVKRYESISSKTKTIFDDLLRDIPDDCPYEGATQSDKNKWKNNTSEIKRKLTTALSSYDKSFSGVQF